MRYIAKLLAVGALLLTMVPAYADTPFAKITPTGPQTVQFCEYYSQGLCSIEIALDLTQDQCDAGSDFSYMSSTNTDVASFMSLVGQHQGQDIVFWTASCKTNEASQPIQYICITPTEATGNEVHVYDSCAFFTQAATWLDPEQL